jgi:arylformamidase
VYVNFLLSVSDTDCCSDEQEVIASPINPINSIVVLFMEQIYIFTMVNKINQDKIFIVRHSEFSIFDFMKLFLDNDHFIDTNSPLDLSIVLSDDIRNPRAWYVEPPRFEPVRTECYIGSVKEGGDVNFRDIYFNPHGHGTHTECLGHITEEIHSVNETMHNYFYRAKLVSILPKRIERENGDIDFVITPEQISALDISDSEALIIRTMPNDATKTSRNYSSSNPPYLDAACAGIVIENGIEHLLIDLPSVDRESDGGVLAFHHAFWQVPHSPNYKRTITELIYADNSIKDGAYILSFHIAPFNNDAAPSRPVLYDIKMR